MRSDFYVFLMKLQLATTTTATAAATTKTVAVASCRRCLRRIGDFHKWEPKHLFLDFHVTLFIVGGVGAGCPNKPNDPKGGEQTLPLCSAPVPPVPIWAEGVACNIYI